MGNESNRIFYGAAIQGEKDRGARAGVHASIIQAIRGRGFDVVSSHTSGTTREEAARLLEEAIGPLPSEGQERYMYVRGKMIEGVEGEIEAAIFEVSTPSLGTGIELAHAYLRSRMGLKQVPILVLYEEDYWPNQLSTMVRGISQDEMPFVKVQQYSNVEDAAGYIDEFLSGLSTTLKTFL